MSEIPRNQGIESFKITQRINDSLTSWSVNFLTTQTNTDFKTGKQFNISLFDTISGRTALIGGRILKIGKTKKDNNKIYTFSGKDAGFALVTQPYNLDCSLYANSTFSMETKLGHILNNTGITIGSGTPSFDKEILFHTIGNISGGFCGIYKTKKEAIDKLFKLYSQQAGTNKIRWYIDNQGKLHWFETGKNRGITLDINIEDPQIIDFSVEDNAENIVNDLTGYGCDDSVVSHQNNALSIAQHGLRIGDPLKDTNLKTMAEIRAKVAEELRQKSWPIYTAKLVIAGYYDINCGEQIQFKEDEDYPNTLFTLVQKDVDGSPANVVTTLQFSTDESAIAPPTTTDVTQAIVKNAINSVKSDFGRIVDVSKDDCTQMLTKPYGSNTLVNTKSSNSCGTNNVGGLLL